MAFGEFGERHAAAGKSRRGKTEGPGQSASPRCGPVVSSDALALRQVCRAGFAGCGTACELSLERHSRYPSRNRRASSSARVTGAEQVKLRQTYAVARPSTGGRARAGAGGSASPGSVATSTRCGR